ncbi:DUF58 domain-containing protein [Ruminococcus sp. Marseille-P6503]|uniref:DUF58 domain-containing protein n=1 Tax=Ruminococcus sp. Marseille-P6503 TaxID=2364796 RepID=UPI0013DDBEA8|nr:DUF58 domain-containing protein [Ruminococcus sp. Marseille-P6503]
MKHFIAYLFCIAVAAAIAVLIDGSGGIMIGLILVSALIFSELTLLFFRRKISFEAECSQKLLSKGDILEVSLKLRKKTILPTPFVEAEFSYSPQLEVEDKTVYRLALASMNYEKITVPFKAVSSGMSYVKIKRIRLMDFLGIFSVSVFDSVKESGKYPVRILPRIPDTGVQPEILKTTSVNSGFDDTEEETSETAVGATGVPGYEHRVYVPGDPVKKINWKLSSKRDIYMIRLDEKLAVASQVFVLDIPEFEDITAESCRNIDIVIEGCLAMLSMLVSQGLESDVYYYKDKWNCVNIKNAADILDFQEKLSWFSPVTPPERIPAEAIQSGGIVCFTSADVQHENLASEIFGLKDAVFVSHENCGFSGADNLWICTSDFEFKKPV